MLIGLSEKQVENWKEEIHKYEKCKRTKRPFGKEVPSVEKVTKKEVFAKESKFNPILQFYKDKIEQQRSLQHEQIQKMNHQLRYLKNNYKYCQDYDIVNFHPTTSLPIQNKSQTISYENRKKEIKDPLPDIHDIINGKKYPPDYLAKKQVKLPKKYARKYFSIDQSRVYNIVNGRYNQDHQNQYQREMEDANTEIMNKFSKSKANYEGFFNPELEKSTDMDNSERFGKNYSCRYPPSYKNREPYIQDLTAPLPDALSDLDSKATNAKQRYRLRYEVEDSHQQRGFYLAQKKEIDSINRVKNSKISLQKSKQFDYLNTQRQERKDELIYGKQITGVLGLSERDQSNKKSPFKSGGFD